MMKHKALSRLILVACLCWLVLTPRTVWSQHAPHRGPGSVSGVGAAASSFELKSLDGRAVGLADFRGRPLLINELAARAGKDGYAVLGIAVEDTRAAIMQYAQEARLVFPIALDLNSRVKRAYRIFGPPATFFIDAQGTIRDVVTGPITAERARAGLKKAGVPL
jgi:cytochrome c biogenesis protein CcmG/thiol:disulfide interchange protein DsbE